jgi:hypothetical protein
MANKWKDFFGKDQTMRSQNWKGLILVMLIVVVLGICDSVRPHAEGRYLTPAGPSGFFFMLDRMTGGFRVCAVLGGVVGPGGCSQGLDPMVATNTGDPTRFAMHYTPR